MVYMLNDVVSHEVEQWLVRNGYIRNFLGTYRKTVPIPSKGGFVESHVDDDDIINNPDQVVQNVEAWHKFYEVFCSWWKGNDQDTIPDWSILNDPKKDINDDEQKRLNQALCRHVWVDYVGLNEKYQFCRTCDLKREPNDKKF